jgi:hypothetical protein
MVEVQGTKYGFKYERRNTKYGNKVMSNAERRLKIEEVDTRYQVWTIILFPS